MKRLVLIFSIICIAFSSCDNTIGKSQQPSEEMVKKDLTASPDAQLHVSWTDSAKVQMSLDSSLSYTSHQIECDSALAISYTGYEGEHSFLPVNSKGQWINTIHKVKKLTRQQERYIISVIGNKKTYIDPIIVACYTPNHGIVYFKKGKVIGQTAICLSCARLESTIRTGDKKQEGLLNQQARQQLDKLCKELQFSDCLD